MRNSGAVRWLHLLQGQSPLPAWSGWMLSLCLALLLGWEVAQVGWLAAPVLPVLLIGIPLSWLLLTRAEVGVHVVLVLAFFISVPNRLMEGVPMGISLDVTISLSFLGVLVRTMRSSQWKTFTTPVTPAILLWATMNLAEVVNPWAASRAAWLYVIRPAVEYMMLFFIAYEALQTPNQLKRFLIAFLGWSLVSAVWGIRQATVGYFDWERNYVLSHDLVHLVFNYGRWRAIGSIGSPSQFGMIMAFVSVFSMALLAGWKSRSVRFFLAAVSIASLLAMVFSGTRTAYIIIPVFFFVWVLLAGTFRLYALAVVLTGVMAVVATMPTSNYHIQRIQSAFKASEDASYQTRARNRAMIMPWIASHPIGGGLGSTGVWGQRFSPGTFLANFPPDSGLIRVAVELGWIGLFFFLFVYYRVLGTGSLLFRKMKDPFYRSIAGGLIAGIAPLLLAEWGQEVVGVFPMSLLFWMLVAVLFRAVHFDQTGVRP